MQSNHSNSLQLLLDAALTAPPERSTQTAPLSVGTVVCTQDSTNANCPSSSSACSYNSSGPQSPQTGNRSQRVLNDSELIQQLLKRGWCCIEMADWFGAVLRMYCAHLLVPKCPDLLFICGSLLHKMPSLFQIDSPKIINRHIMRRYIRKAVQLQPHHPLAQRLKRRHSSFNHLKSCLDTLSSTSGYPALGFSGDQ